MAQNRIQVKRTNVSGRTPNTTNSSNSQYIDAGEFALNMPDGILYTSNGSSLIPVGANNANVNVTSRLDVTGLTTLSTTAGTPLSIYKYNQNSPSIFMYSANGTKDVPTQTLTGDVIGGFNMFGYGPTGWAGGPSIRIRGFAAENNGTTVNRGADLTFETVSLGGVSAQERLRITANGDIGIGISLPTAKLSVANSTSPTSQHIYGTYTDGSNYERINLTANSTGHYVLSEEAGTGTARELYLGANNATMVTVAANGNVGVGTTTPTHKLEVIGNIFGNGTITSNTSVTLNAQKPLIFRRSTTDAYGWQMFADPQNSLTITTGINGAGTTLGLWRDTGEFGIGNTAPAHKLRVEGTVSIAGNTTPSANLTFDLGSPTLYWNNVYSNNIVTNSASFSSNVSVGGTLSVTNNVIVNKNLDITSKNVVGLTSLEATVLTTFPVGDYKGGKFTIMAKRGTDTHMAEVMVTHNVESAFYNEYSVVYSNTSLFNVSADISGSNVRLLATASTPSDIQFQVMENKFAVDLDTYDRAGTLLLDRSGSVIDERRITREISFGLDFINNSYGLVT